MRAIGLDVAVLLTADAALVASGSSVLMLGAGPSREA
ncbi:MAG: hypothetical protein JWQ36_74 [Enterovirga sp.]|jgi:hypothetical protein|nr:hypothetical protein [Enterovirga sp.]